VQRGELPDRRCSPGAYYSKLTKAVICSPRFSTSTIRKVPQSEKFAVEREYGKAATYYSRSVEIDHIVPLELARRLLCTDRGAAGRHHRLAQGPDGVHDGGVGRVEQPPLTASPHRGLTARIAGLGQCSGMTPEREASRDLCRCSSSRPRRTTRRRVLQVALRPALGDVCRPVTRGLRSG
jgi:hypothetical protein